MKRRTVEARQDCALWCSRAQGSRIVGYITSIQEGSKCDVLYRLRRGRFSIYLGFWGLYSLFTGFSCLNSDFANWILLPSHRSICLSASFSRLSEESLFLLDGPRSLVFVALIATHSNLVCGSDIIRKDFEYSIMPQKKSRFSSGSLAYWDVET